MHDVSVVLEGIRDQLPPFIAPIANELCEVIESGREKVDKYEARGQMHALIRAGCEAVRGFSFCLHHPVHILSDIKFATVSVARTDENDGCSYT
jgi:hypothetical protein